MPHCSCDPPCPADRATPINLAQHSYFNLAGHSAGGPGILNHELTIHGDHYTPVGGRVGGRAGGWVGGWGHTPCRGGAAG